MDLMQFAWLVAAIMIFTGLSVLYSEIQESRRQQNQDAANLKHRATTSKKREQNMLKNVKISKRGITLRSTLNRTPEWLTPHKYQRIGTRVSKRS
jgi:hypothetical protein